MVLDIQEIKPVWMKIGKRMARPTRINISLDESSQKCSYVAKKCDCLRMKWTNIRRLCPKIRQHLDEKI